MLDVSGTIHVDQPVADVFAFMDEPENQAVITPSLTDVSTVDRLDNGGKRATYTYSMVGISLTGEVAATTYEPDGRIVFEMSGDLSGTIEWTFEADDGGTRVGYVATYDVPVPVGEAAVEPLVRKYNERQLRSTLQNLKTTLEAED